MSLAKEDLEQIQVLVDKAISQAQINAEPVLSNVRYDLEIRDRTLKVEEELKHQRELLIQGFQSMEKRFEAADIRFKEQNENFNKRFESIDKRFEEQNVNFNKRFESIDKRFVEQNENFNKRFEEQNENFNKRFEEQNANINARFEQQRNETVQRFEFMEKQFETMHKDMKSGFTEISRRLERFMFWTFGLISSATILIISFK